MRIAILTNRVAHFDAVSMDACLQEQTLRAAGYDVQLFAQSWEDFSNVQHIEMLSAYIKAPRDLVLLHYSTAWPEVLPLLAQLNCLLVLKFHNITPSHFFKDYNKDYETRCQQGKQCLLQIIKQVPALHCWADTRFNAKQLQEFLQTAGLPALPEDRLQVLPVLHQVEHFVDSEADLNMLRALQMPERDYILNVGRIVPNKNHALLLRAFHYYRKFMNPDAVLLLAGKRDPMLARYNQQLDVLITELDLHEAVVFQENLSAPQLKACYLQSCILVMTSLHEGFGVPLIEAQALGVPLLALDRAAVAETAGSGALLFNAEDAFLFASAMQRLRKDQQLDQYLRQQGLQNYQARFEPGHIKKQLLELVQNLASGDD